MYNLGLIDTPSGLFQFLRVNGMGVLTGVYCDASGVPLFVQKNGENGIELYNLSGVNGVNVFQSGGLVYVDYDGGTGNQYTRLIVSGSQPLNGNISLVKSGDTTILVSGNNIIIGSPTLLGSKNINITKSGGSNVLEVPYIRVPKSGIGLMRGTGEDILNGLLFNQKLSGIVSDNQMTSYTGYYGVVTSSYYEGITGGPLPGAYASLPYNAFNEFNPYVLGSKMGWRVDRNYGSGAWLQYEFDIPKQITHYNLYSYNDGGAGGDAQITAWTISGSNNGTDWNLIDQRTADASSKPIFKTQNQFNCRFYRFIIDQFNWNPFYDYDGRPNLRFLGYIISGDRIANYSDIQPENSGQGIGVFSHKDETKQYFRTLSGVAGIIVYEQNGVICISGSGSLISGTGGGSGSGVLFGVNGGSPLNDGQVYNLSGVNGVSILLQGTNIIVSGSPSQQSSGQSQYRNSAWITYSGANGGSNPIVYASGNISGIIRNGDGDYSIYFLTGFSNTHYLASYGARGTAGQAALVMEQHDNPFRTQSGIRIYNLSQNFITKDNCYVTCEWKEY